MGSFFTNIHIRLTNASREDELVRIENAVIESAAKEGFILTSEGEEPDRIVAIAAPPSSGWLVLYDENSDGMDVKAMERLARSVSKGRFAISALVADSDELILTLFRNGRRADRIAFSPSEPPPSPKAVSWRPLLGGAIESFEAAFTTGAAFAEDPLITLGEILGWDEDYSSVGFSHLDELPEQPARLLRFSLPAEQRFYWFSKDAPQLKQPGNEKVGQSNMIVGMPTDGSGCGAFFENIGRAGRGMTVLLEYSPEVAAHLDITGVCAKTHDFVFVQAKPTEAIDVEGQRLLRARFPEFPLKPSPHWSKLDHDWQSMKVFNIGLKAWAWVEFVGTAKSAGEFTFTMWVIPHENAAEGSAIAHIHATVHGAA